MSRHFTQHLAFWPHIDAKDNYNNVIWSNYEGVTDVVEGGGRKGAILWKEIVESILKWTKDKDYYINKFRKEK